MLPPSVLHGEEEYKDTFSGSFPHRRCRLFCMGVSAHCRGNCPACTGSSPHDLFDHNVKTTFVALIYGARIMVLALLAPAWGSPSTSGKRRAWTSPSCSVLHSGRRSDRNLASSRDQAQAKAAAGGHQRSACGAQDRRVWSPLCRTRPGEAALQQDLLSTSCRKGGVLLGEQIVVT